MHRPALGLLLAFTCWTADLMADDQTTSLATADDQTVTHAVDWSDPAFTPPACPQWARVSVPEWVEPFKGVVGLQDPWALAGPAGSKTAGLDRYQANHFVVYRAETADFLYSQYTPLDAGYTSGLLPGYEAVVERFVDDSMSETEKALTLLHKAMPAVTKHPTEPPYGERVAPDRNLDDEALLANGHMWCNEQARVFIRLLQVAGLQGRIVHLWGQSHTIAEFHADGQWVMADATYFFVARDDKGNMLSAAACHDGGEGQRHYAKAKKARLMELAKLPDGQVSQRWRQNKAYDLKVDELATQPLAFGVINYPLPPAPSDK